MHRSPALALMLTACATSAPPPEPTPPPAAAPEPRAEAPRDVHAALQLARSDSEAPLRELPSQCASEGKVCVPPAAFVERLCRSHSPDVALAMFRKDTPWTRAWLRGNVEAWYASGGRSRPQQLKYAEEVIVIASRAGGSGAVQVSGGGSYDVYRWNGSCVSLMEGELTFFLPATPDVATIDWKRLDDDIKTALEKNERISSKNLKRREACKELSEDGIKRCAKAEEGLSRLIAEYVRAGGEVPGPKVLP